MERKVGGEMERAWGLASVPAPPASLDPSHLPQLLPGFNCHSNWQWTQSPVIIVAAWWLGQVMPPFQDLSGPICSSWCYMWQKRPPTQPSALTATSSPSSSSSFSTPSPFHPSVAPSILQLPPSVLLGLHVHCHSQPISCSLTALPSPPPVAEQILGFFVKGCLLESSSLARGSHTHQRAQLWG